MEGDDIVILFFYREVIRVEIRVNISLNFITFEMQCYAEIFYIIKSGYYE